MSNLIEMFFDAELGLAEAKAHPVGSSSADLSLWAHRLPPQQAEKLAVVEARVGQLNLVVAALVRSLVKQGVLKPAELSELMKQIDLEDGKADGRLGEKLPNTPDRCPKCDAKVAPGRPFCVFCGLRFDGSPTDTDHEISCGENSP